MFAVVDGAPAALIGVSDRVKDTTAEALRALRAEGLRVVMVTGDNAVTARAVAGRLGIDSQRWSRHAVVAVAAFCAGAALGTLLVGETTGGAIAVFGALVLAAAAVLRRRPAKR
jgi:MYXO-CTERM domain-containing protein